MDLEAKFEFAQSFSLIIGYDVVIAAPFTKLERAVCRSNVTRNNIRGVYYNGLFSDLFSRDKRQ